MDTKRVITATLVALGLILIYMQVVGYLERKYGWNQPPASTATTAPVPQTMPVATASTGAAAAQPSTGPSIVAAPPGVQVVPASQPAAARLGSAATKDATFAMQADIAPDGAGFDAIFLNQFNREARSLDPYTFQQPIPGHADTRPLATRTITIDGTPFDLANVAWNLDKERSSATVAWYSVELKKGDAPLLKLWKKYEVFTRADAGQGYEMSVDFGFENESDAPLRIVTEFNGPTTPPVETFQSRERAMIGGYVKGNGISLGVHYVEDLKSEKDGGTLDMTRGENHHAAWAGTFSNYFAAIVLFPNAGTENTYIGRIVAHGINLDAKLLEDRFAHLTFATTEIKLDPHKPLALPFRVFAGPKWRQVLDNSYYASFPRDYRSTLVIRSGCYTICTFDFLMDGLVYLLRGMHWLLHDWGLAIIGLVVIVRTILHPITKKSQVSMAKMSKMGPEMERLKKKYADDKEALNKAMWEFQKEQGLTPILGCLPMFLQMPIWVALYGVLQSTFELRQAPFLWTLTWIHDLSLPDQLVRFSHPVQFWFFEFRSLNLLPILMAVAFYLQQKLTPKPVAATPEQAQQQKMMQWTSLIFPVFLYSYPSGLNLYILTSTAIGVVESKIVRDHIKQREEAEKAGKVFVETKPTRASRRGVPDVRSQEAPKGCLTGWWFNLLAQAEQMKNDTDRRGKRKA